jgi:hypothetical protein
VRLRREEGHGAGRRRGRRPEAGRRQAREGHGAVRLRKEEGEVDDKGYWGRAPLRGGSNGRAPVRGGSRAGGCKGSSGRAPLRGGGRAGACGESSEEASRGHERLCKLLRELSGAKVKGGERENSGKNGF